MTSAVKLGDVQGIPIVNFAAFIDGSNKQEVADAMLDSFKTVGFVYLVNHGLAKEKIDGMFDWVCRHYIDRRRGTDDLCLLSQSKKFFKQPVEVKQLAPHPESGAHHRGTVFQVL